MSPNLPAAIGPMQRVRIYVSEKDTIGRAPACQSIVTFLRSHNAAGVTVLRALEGFGASGRLHASRIGEDDGDLPLVIEWIDSRQRIDALLAELCPMVPGGMVTVEPTEVVRCATQAVRPLSDALPIASIMTRDVLVVHKDAPIRNVVELMRTRGVRAVPVVDGGTVVGLITDSDLVQRAGLGVRLALLPGLSARDQADRMDAMSRVVAGQVMTSPAVTVPAGAPLTVAAEIMVRRQLKRLPVVDETGAVVGIVSRLDLFRTVADFGERREHPAYAVPRSSDARVSAVMRNDIPTVRPDAPLSEVIEAVESTELARALVVDADRRVQGMVSARAVLERVSPASHPTIVRSLMQRLGHRKHAGDDAQSARHASAQVAAELMTTEVACARPDDPLTQVIGAMVEGAHKLVAVVDEEGRLLGGVDRADVLRGMLEDAK